MLKRIFLFLVTNIAVLVVLNLFIFILSTFFWIDIYAYWSYTTLFIFALIFWFTWSFISLFISKWMAKKAYWVKIIWVEQYDSLNRKEKVVFDVVRDLSERNNIKIPEIWFYNSEEPNAFATGASKNSSLVAVSSWLLNLMDEKAIEGVIWHEMAHILNWDMVTMTLLQWIINTFVIFFAKIVANLVSSFVDEDFVWITRLFVDIIMQIIFWILASVITMWFSRHREFKADEWSAKYVWKEKMIAWLEALKKMQSLAQWDNSKLATMKISTKKRTWIMSLLSSHPDLDDRIKALKDLNI